MKNKTKLLQVFSPHRVVFALFLTLQAAVIAAVPLFGDDYYYASFVKKGLRFFVTENVVHYTRTNGRALVHLLDQLLLADGAGAIWKILNLTALAFAVYFTAKAAAKNNKSFAFALMLTCAFTALLEIAVLRQSVYWATGSMNYLFPYALFITYWHLLNNPSVKAVRYLWILAFAVGFSTEQAGFAAFAATVWLALRRRKSTAAAFYYNNLIACGAGLALQILAPGNAQRKTHFPEFYAKTLFERAAENAKPLYNIIFNADGIYIFILAALIITLCAALHKVLRKRSRYKLFYAFAAAALFVAIAQYVRGIFFNREVLTELVFLIFLTFGLVAFAVYCTARAVKQQRFEPLFFATLSPILQIAMLFSPQYGPRTLLISAFCLFIPLIDILSEAFEKVKSKLPTRKKLLQICFLILVTVSFYKITQNIRGYHENLAAHRGNAAAVADYKRNPNERGILKLARLPNPDYKYTMPYDDPYHLYWYKILNGLPEDLEIQFE